MELNPEKNEDGKDEHKVVKSRLSIYHETSRTEIPPPPKTGRGGVVVKCNKNCIDNSDLKLRHRNQSTYENRNTFFSVVS